MSVRFGGFRGLGVKAFGLRTLHPILFFCDLSSVDWCRRDALNT